MTSPEAAPRTAAGRAWHDDEHVGGACVTTDPYPVDCNLKKLLRGVEAEALEEGMMRQLERQLHDEQNPVPDVVLGMQASSTVEERAEAAAGTALDVERLATVLAKEFRFMRPSSGNWALSAKAIAAEYARLAGVDSDRQPVADASEDDA